MAGPSGVVFGFGQPGGAHVIDQGLAGRGCRALGAVHAAVALVAVDLGPVGVEPAAVAAQVAGAEVHTVAAFAAGGLGFLPGADVDQGLVGVLGGGPGPVLARQGDDPLFAFAAGRPGVGGAAQHDPAGVLGVAQDAVDGAGGPGRTLAGGRRAQVGEPGGRSRTPTASPRPATRTWR